MRTASRLLLLGSIAFAQITTAAPVLYELASDSSMINHWPGPDGMVGTADDIIDGAAVTVGGSGPNTPGALSSGSFEFGPLDPEPKLASPYDAVTFVNLGSIMFDADAGSESPLIQSFIMAMGTEPYFGHGPYSAVTTGPALGTSTATTFDLVSVPYSTLVNGNPASGEMNLSGTYRVVDPNGPPTGDSYLDNVLTPIALSQGVDSYIMLTGTGSTGVYGDIPIQFTLVGFQADTIAAPTLHASLAGGNIQLSFDTQAGMNYQIQIATNLLIWADLGAAVIGDGLTKTQEVATADYESAFFRFIATQPPADTAPTDTEFTALFVGTTFDDGYVITTSTRFDWEGDLGNWDYTKTGINTGILVFTYDEGGNDPSLYREVYVLTFDTATTGAYVYSEWTQDVVDPSSVWTGPFDLSGSP